jgi:hypothetical protein
MKRLWMDGLGLVAGLLGSVFTNDFKAVQRLSHPQREAAAASSSTGRPEQVRWWSSDFIFIRPSLSRRSALDAGLNLPRAIFS